MTVQCIRDLQERDDVHQGVNRHVKGLAAVSYKRLLWCVVPILVGCSAPEPLTMLPDQAAPQQWSTPITDDKSALFSAGAAGLFDLPDESLQVVVQEALTQSPVLAAAFEKLQQTRLGLTLARADQLPAVSLSTGVDRAEGSDQSFSINTSASWNPDVWGELRASQRQAQLEYEAALASFKQERLILVSTVYTQWFQLQEAQLLLKLYRQRSESVQRDLDIIEAGYLQGLYEALDLFLARNDVNAQRAKVEAQEQSLIEIQRNLEQRVGRYPDGLINSDSTLPILAPISTTVLPANIIAKRPDLQASWISLLAADQALAAAYRSRFPSLTLTGRYGGSSDALSDLVSTGNLAWSVGASLAASIFDAGRLKANQEQKASQRRELELVYLNDLYTAFREVENALSAESTLRNQYELYLNAQENAQKAEQVAFERYQRGLEDYNTVLEAQRRSLDAQTSMITLRRSLLQNRVELVVALGGDLLEFIPEQSTSVVELPPS